MRELLLTVAAEEDGITAQTFLKRHGFSHRAVIKLKYSGGLTRGGALLRTIDTLHAGEVVRAVLPDGGNAEPNPDIQAAAAYEDEDVIVFDKPPFLPVHPSIRHRTDTLANLYEAMYPNSAFRPVHRLDRNTSGLCVCAKNKLSASLLSGNVSKKYYAIVCGDIREGGVIDLPIGRVSDSLIKRTVTENGQSAVTLYKPILRANGKTLLEVELKTGRTHQIRVHMSHIGYPLCGDDLYGGDCSEIDRQALHCGAVTFVSPVSGVRAELVSEIPPDMRRLLE